ncbi:MAG: type IV secretion protein IcmC [Legionella sp.]|nr:type IV secretion protein IcmC [Legionella sp.]
MGGITDQVDILTNLSNSLGPIERLITGAGYLIGCMFIFKALYSLRMYGESRTMMSNSTSIKEPLLYLFVGVMLIYLPTAMSILLESTFSVSSPLQYAPVNSKNVGINTLFGSGSAIGKPLSMFIQVIGLVAFVRGWVLLARSGSQGQQPGGAGKGMIHIFGGILAVNIVGTLQMINNTLYG